MLLYIKFIAKWRMESFSSLSFCTLKTNEIVIQVPESRLIELENDSTVYPLSYLWLQQIFSSWLFLILKQGAKANNNIHYASPRISHSFVNFNLILFIPYCRTNVLPLFVVDTKNTFQWRPLILSIPLLVAKNAVIRSLTLFHLFQIQVWRGLSCSLRCCLYLFWIYFHYFIISLFVDISDIQTAIFIRYKYLNKWNFRPWS